LCCSQQDQKTSIKQAEPVSKTVGDQKPTKVVDKNTDSVVKVMFKVPILNIEMKGEFDEGYKGLVNINLQDFVLNMKKENSYSTEIQVHLKTLIMEDLLEDENSSKSLWKLDGNECGITGIGAIIQLSGHD
jgi:hypothetical protein